MSKLPRISLKPEVTHFLQGVFANEEVGGFLHFSAYGLNKETIQPWNTVSFPPCLNGLKKNTYACISFVIYVELFVPSLDNVLNEPRCLFYIHCKMLTENIQNPSTFLHL